MLFATASYGQSHGVLVYGNFPYLNANPRPQKIDFESALLNFGGVSVAYHRRNQNKLFVRLQGSYYQRSRSDSKFVYSRNGAYGQMELGCYVWQSQEKKLRAYLSVLVSGHWQHEDVEISDVFENPLTSTQVGIGGTSMGGIEYDFWGKFYLDMGIKLLGVTLQHERFIIETPPGAIPFDSSAIGLHSLQNRNLRIGVGYWF